MRATSRMLMVSLFSVLLSITAWSQSGVTHEVERNMRPNVGVRFQENKGQVRHAPGDSTTIRFMTSMGGVALFFRNDGISLVWDDDSESAGAAFRAKRWNDREIPSPRIVSRHRVDIDFASGTSQSRVHGEHPLPGALRFYHEHCPQGISNVHEYQSLVYENVFPGVKYHVTSEGGDLVLHAVLGPGADPSHIRFSIEGESDAVQRTERRPFIVEHEPAMFDRAHRDAAGERPDEIIPVLRIRFPLSALANGESAGANVTIQNRAPSPWSTYIGGIGYDLTSGLSVGSDGAIYASGHTQSVNFPVASGVQMSLSGPYDAYLVKLDSLGRRIWATYYGGSSTEADVMVATSTRNLVVITGTTTSRDFPTASAFQSTAKGGEEGFLVMFDSAGARRWATYCGGSSQDRILAVHMDEQGNVHFCGYGKSSDFPVKNAFQPIKSFFDDAFLGLVTQAGVLEWATYLGGNRDEILDGIDLDAFGNVYVSGYTNSTNLPVQNAAQPTNGGGWDGYAARFSPTGQRQWLTYHGGAMNDYGQGIAVSRAGTVVLSGRTESDDVPVLAAFQPIRKGGMDAFVVIYDANGRRTSASYLGGSGDEICAAPAIDENGMIALYGHTSSNDFPVVNPVQPTLRGGMDCYIAILSSPGVVSEASYWGGSNEEAGWWPRIDDNGGVYFCGMTNSTDFPVSAGSFQRGYGGGSWDGFVVKYGCAPPVIRTEPRDTIVCVGQPLTLFCDVGSMPEAERRWERSLDNGRSWAVIPGETAPTLPVVGYPADTVLLFRVHFSNACGSASSRITRVLFASPPSTTIQIQGDTVGCAGTTAVLSIAETYGVEYQWYRNGSTLPTEVRARLEVTEPGAYRCVASRSGHCADSTRIVTIRIHPRPLASITPMKDTLLCEGERLLLETPFASDLRYQWLRNGVPMVGSTNAVLLVGSSGKYRVIVVNPESCADTSREVTVTVWPKPHADITIIGDTVRCENAITRLSMPAQAGARYEWYRDGNRIAVGSDPTIAIQASGIYHGVFVATAGCVDTTRRVSILIHPSPRLDLDPDRTLCVGDSSRLGGSVSAGTPPYRYSWSPTVDMDSSTILTPVVTPSRTTAFHLVVTDFRGCEARDTILVEVNAGPVVNILGPHMVCRGADAPYHLGGETAHVLSWDVSGGSIMGSSRQDSVRIHWNTAGTGVLRVRVQSPTTGCIRDTTFSVTIRASLIPVLSTSRSPLLCEGDSVVLSVSEKYESYSWSTGETTPEIRTSRSGLYFVTVVDGSGCTGRSDTIRVTVHPLPRPRITPQSPTHLCEGDSVLLGTESGYVLYRWNTGEPTPTLMVHTAGTYSVEVTDTMGCRGMSDLHTIILRDLPQPHIAGPGEMCDGDTAILDAGDGYVRYAWNTGEDRRIIHAIASGQYQVRVEDSVGCSGMDRHVLLVHPRPQVGIRLDGDTLLAEGDATQWQWYHEGRPLSGENATRLMLGDTGTYQLWGTNAQGCIAWSAEFHWGRKPTRTAVILGCHEGQPIPIGTVIHIPLHLINNAAVPDGEAQEYEATIRYHRSVLHPLLPIVSHVDDGADRIIRIHGTRPASGSPAVLHEIPFLVTLGDVECTTVSIDTVIWNDATMAEIRRDHPCTLCVQVCREGGTRLFLGTGRLQLQQNRPNPFNAITLIDITLIEAGWTEVVVQDILGRPVTTLRKGWMEPGSYTLRYDGSTVQSGTYYIVLTTPSARIHRRMEVVK